MVDINLLKDTKETGEDGQKKVPPPPPISYSSPDRERMTDPTGAPPSGMGVWFKRLLSKEPAGPEPVPFEKLAKPGRPPVTGGVPSDVTVAPADMFAELDQPAPSKKPAPRAAATVPPSTPPPRSRRRESEPAPAFGSGGFSVNLLPTEEEAPQSHASTFRRLGIAAGLSVVLVAAALGIIYLLQMNVTNRTTDLQEEITQVNQTIEVLRPKQREALAFADRVSVYRTSLTQHIRWSRFFDKLQQYTLKDVTLNGAFRATTGGSLTLTGTAPSLDIVARQLAVLEKASDFMTDVELDTVATGASEAEASTISFSITGSMVTALFLAPAAATTGGAQ